MNHRARVTWWVVVAALIGGAAFAGGLSESEAEIRARLQATPIGRDIDLTLKNGDRLRGKLADLGEDSFAMLLDDAATRERLGLQHAKIKRRIDYGDVAALEGAARVALTGEGLQFRLRLGDDVRVRTSGGDTVKGRVEDFDGNVLALDGRSFSLSDGDVDRIELRVGDSNANGALVGAAVGVGFVALACLYGCEPAVWIGGALVYGGAGAGIGALLDALKKESHVVYSRPAPAKGASWVVSPLFGRGVKGVVVSLSF